MQLLSNTLERHIDSNNDKDPTLNNIQDNSANSPSIFVSCKTLVGVSILWTDLRKLMKYKHRINGTLLSLKAV